MARLVRQPRERVSIHAFRGEGDRTGVYSGSPRPAFQSTPSGGKATFPFSPPHGARSFQSTPSGGKATRARFEKLRIYVRRFNPRLPGGRRRAVPLSYEFTKPFQSTPSGGKATLEPVPWIVFAVVSIHAFRGEGDSRDWRLVRTLSCFNPRLPGGRRPGHQKGWSPNTRVSIHAFRGEGDPFYYPVRPMVVVSIHAFRGEGDLWPDLIPCYPWSFNPRLPGGRRRIRRNCARTGAVVSIHAFRGEGDTYSVAPDP